MILIFTLVYPKCIKDDLIWCGKISTKPTVISPPKHSEASWAESNGFTSASLNRYLQQEVTSSQTHAMVNYL